MRALRASDPHAHAVVFTHHVDTHRALEQLAEAERFAVHEIAGSVAGDGLSRWRLAWYLNRIARRRVVHKWCGRRCGGGERAPRIDGHADRRPPP